MIVAAVLIGMTVLFSRRGRAAPPLPFYAGGVGLLLVIAALIARSGMVSHIPHTGSVRTRCPGLARRVIFSLTILDVLIIGEWLIERGNGTSPMSSGIC